MVDGRIGTDRTRIDHLDRTDARNSSEIIALEVDDHRQLGSLLGIGGELFNQPSVLFWCLSAGSGSFDGAGLQDVSAFSEQHLHRCTQQLIVAKMKPRQVVRFTALRGRFRERAQVSGSAFDRHTPAQVHLINIT